MNGQRDVVLDIVAAIAKREGVDPEDLDFSLHDHVDTDALAQLVGSEQDGWVLTFAVPGHEVTVTGEGEIRLDGETVESGGEVQFHEVD